VADAFTARDLSKRYGSTQALRGISMEVAEGEIVGLLGPNGAGKSTLAKIACGLVRATGGEARVSGQPAGSAPARAAVGYLAVLFRFPGWARAEELLSLHQRLAGSAGGADERRALLELVGLWDAAAVRVDAMSKGMQQRLGIAQALIGSPRLLLLDEPTSALDPAGRRVVRGVLAEVRSRGISVLLSSHLLGEVELVCDRVAILVDGKIVEQGTPAQLTRPRGIEVETASGVRAFADAAREDAPKIVADLVAAGERIYGVRTLASTLEDAYLEAVEAPRS
jgi:ABC-2 type transport system ATP-binding protein